MEFKIPQIEDKKIMDLHLKNANQIGCEFTFSNIFLWSRHYDASFTLLDDMIVFKIGTDSPSFMFPIGDGDVKNTIDKMMDYCKDNNYPFRMYSITKEMRDIIESLYPDKFEFTEDRDSFEYIYNSEDLITLKGKKYHSKRNHINKFMENDWSYEAITRDNIDECLEMNRKWCVENGCGQDKSKKAEMCVIRNAFKYFEELELKGGLIRLDGEVVAFSFGEEATKDAFVVHVEKAFSEVQGAYPIINREFAAHEAKDYKYINREEDLGIEGLRKAKLSYKPAFLLEKFVLREK